jgi:predicted dehydrogenase
MTVGDAGGGRPAQYAGVDEVIVSDGHRRKLSKISDQLGFATTTDLDALIADGSMDLEDIHPPTRVHAEVAIRATQSGRDVLIELPLASTLEDAQHIVDAQ